MAVMFGLKSSSILSEEAKTSGFRRVVEQGKSGRQLVDVDQLKRNKLNRLNDCLASVGVDFARNEIEPFQELKTQYENCLELKKIGPYNSSFECF